MEKVYVSVNNEGIVVDAITFPYADYIEVEVEKINSSILGGWFKLENGSIVEYLELKPKTKDDEITELKEQIIGLEAQNNGLMLAIAELAMANEQDKIETQLAIAELANIITGGME